MGDNTYKPYLIPGRDTATDQNVGIISRVDPTTALFRDEQRATIYRSDSYCGNLPDPSYESGVSKHFIARFNVPGLGLISIIGAHLLAIPTQPDRCIRREAQATVLRNIAQNERNLGREVIILGDLNDYDNDVLDASDSVPTSRVSDLLKYNGQSRLMYNVVEMITNKANRYSSWWDKDYDCVLEPGELTLIDHLLISPALYDQVNSVRIFNTFTPDCDNFESDHYPIRVILSTTSKKEVTIESSVDSTQSEEVPSSSWNWTTSSLIIGGIAIGVILVVSIVVIVKRLQGRTSLTGYGSFDLTLRQ